MSYYYNNEDTKHDVDEGQSTLSDAGSHIKQAKDDIDRFTSKRGGGSSSISNEGASSSAGSSTGSSAGEEVAKEGAKEGTKAAGEVGSGSATTGATGATVGGTATGAAAAAEGGTTAGAAAGVGEGATAGAGAGAAEGGAAAGGAGSAAGAGAGASVGTVAAVIIAIILLIIGAVHVSGTPAPLNYDEDLQGVDENGEVIFDIEPVFERTVNGLKLRYYESLGASNVTNTISDGALEYLKETYEVDLKEDKLSSVGALASGLTLTSEKTVDNFEYKINLKAVPYMSVEELAQPISIYCVAVNGALFSTASVDEDFYDTLGVTNTDLFSESMYYYDADTRSYRLNSTWKKVVASSEYTSSSSKAYENAVKDFANEHEEVFGIEERYKLWDYNDFSYTKTEIMVEEEYEETNIVTKTREKTVYERDEKTGKLVSRKVTEEYEEEETVTKTRMVPKLDENGNQCYEITITGSIVVPINYDVSYYKYEIFDEICDTLANKKMEEKMESEYLRDIEELTYDYYYEKAMYEIDLLVRTQYDMTYEYYLSDEVKEKIDRINEKLIDSGVFCDINGLNSANVGMLAFYGISGDAFFGDYGYQNYATAGLSDSQLRENARIIWGHVLAVYRQNGHTPIRNNGMGYQCVDFARVWMYDHYGIFPSLGNGANCAKRLVEQYPDKFALSSSPVAGGICSVGPTNDNEFGHVMCIEAVDYENKTVTFSDGNVTTITGNLRICRTMTFQEFYNNYRAHGIKFAVPIS